MSKVLVATLLVRLLVGIIVPSPRPPNSVQVALVVDDFNQEIFMVGDYYNNFDKEMYRHIFDLVAGGRPSVIGCQVLSVCLVGCMQNSKGDVPSFFR